MQEFDGRTPKLVNSLLRCSRSYPWKIPEHGYDALCAHNHQTFTFRNRPGWRIDAYNFEDVIITTPWNEVKFCWFKTGTEYDSWTGTIDHSVKWYDICKSKGNFTEEIDEGGHNIIHLPAEPEYIEGCVCISCNKNDYDGLVWNVIEKGY
jgi:hypothetical protein